MTLSQSRPDQLRPSDDDGWGPVFQVDQEHLQEAVGCLIGSDPAVDPAAIDRFIEYAGSNRIDLSILWARRKPQNGPIWQVALLVPHPGKTAMVFTSHPAKRSEVPAMGALIDRVTGDLGETVDLAQALLERSETLERAAFRQGGFLELATLSYLHRPTTSKRPTSAEWPADVEVHPYDDARRDDLLRILESSYEDTLDCPGLRGLRRTSDILEGHRATGTWDASLWSLMYIDGRPSGTILLNPSPAQNTIELVYLGLAAAARGRGLGAQLLRHGLDRVATRSERVVSLAVDDQNKPALALYRREGFRPVARRLALIKSLRSAENP